MNQMINFTMLFVQIRPAARRAVEGPAYPTIIACPGNICKQLGVRVVFYCSTFATEKQLKVTRNEACP